MLQGGGAASRLPEGERVPTVNPPGRTLRAETTDPARHQGQNASNDPNHAQLEVIIAMVVNPQ